jgi:hypothetical protein
MASSFQMASSAGVQGVGGCQSAVGEMARRKGWGLAELRPNGQAGKRELPKDTIYLASSAFGRHGSVRES